MTSTITTYLSPDNPTKTVVKHSKDSVFANPETMPSFPGGDAALMEYLRSNVHYPQKACREGKSGRVWVSFVIAKDGSIVKPKVMKSVSPELDDEALRLVKGMPKWTPGTSNGKKVAVKYNIPVSFRLNEDKTKNNQNVPDGKTVTTTEHYRDVLVVIDGKIEESAGNLKPDDIESVSVVKNKELMAKYGNAAKGKEAVLVITTIKNKK